MSRYLGPKCRLCRREGVKLYLKGTRCDSPKCTFVRRPHPPGEHPWARKKQSEFGQQLREKQKAKRKFGVFDLPFRRLFSDAERMKGNTGENLLQLLERRLDNAVLLAGLALSRYGARQTVVHGHIFLNGRRVRTPSIRIKVGDVLTVSGREKSQNLIKSVIDTTKSRIIPSWIEVDHNTMEAKIVALPSRDQVTIDLQEQLIVEFCSK
jgi:small subunit ribosomal protein S4